ncbi:MAG: MotA/TolQ/ExbB proton channel family protein [Sphaerospermopsis sp. SIO1G2]|nr:MotA/TolQ/ExbB proton channel family protein [Sphaerospermopsis sp. SIO1G2]
MGFEILLKGGFVMVVLGCLSIYALAVVFGKIVQFSTYSSMKTNFIEPVMSHVKRGEYTDAEAMLRKTPGPVARIMRTAIRCVLNRDMSIKSRESEIARVGTAEIQVMESHMRGLELVSTIAPLLGLLGTVVGMITVFATLSEAGGRVDPALLAAGIWEALVTTVGGLAVAIPAVAAYYILDSKIEKARVRMRDVAIQILALEDVFIRNEKEQERRELINQRDEIFRSKEEIRREHEEIQKLTEEQYRMQEQMREEQEHMLEKVRTTAQSSGTLQLLSPSYRS